MGRVRAVPRLCDLCPDICLTTEEKAWKNSASRLKFPKEMVFILAFSASHALCRYVHGVLTVS
jgi:hypothetical protein